MTQTDEISGKMAVAHVTKCVKEPGIHLNDPLSRPSAHYVWNRMHELQHQCYWNDRFIAAVMCGMDLHFQRIAAWAAVSNGLTGYWEWTTHCGFEAAAALKYLGVVPADFTPRSRGFFPDYNDLPPTICKALIEKFNLPTYCLVGERPDFSEEELKDLRELDGHYPKASPLTTFAL